MQSVHTSRTNLDGKEYDSEYRKFLRLSPLDILSLIIMFQNKGCFLMNVRLRMYKYCYSNKGAIYAKGICVNWLLIWLLVMS